MSFVVRELPKAKQDKESVYSWITARSPTGALAWLDVYDAVITRLADDADSFSFAPENADCELDVRQTLFKTRRGRVYRLLFFIEGTEALVLRVRGPGQARVSSTEIR